MQRHTNALKQLEPRIRDLVERCNRLTLENRSLRDSQSNLTAEKAILLNKNEQARKRVETMINRLRSLEKSQ